MRRQLSITNWTFTYEFELLAREELFNQDVKAGKRC